MKIISWLLGIDKLSRHLQSIDNKLNNITINIKADVIINGHGHTNSVAPPLYKQESINTIYDIDSNGIMEISDDEFLRRPEPPDDLLSFGG